MSVKEAREQMSDHMALVRQKRPVGLEVRGLDEYMRLADVMAHSELVPAAYRGKPADILLAMGMGAELGFGPMQSLQAIYVVGGRPSLYVEAAIAVVRASGELESLRVEGTDEEATAAATRRGQGTMSVTFSFREAERLGLVKSGGPWHTQRGWMLQTRAIGRVLHRLFPDLLRGVGMVDPSGRPVEQGEAFGGSSAVDPATGEISESAPPIAGGTDPLAELTSRLTARTPERPRPPEPEPPVEDEPEDEDETPERPPQEAATAPVSETALLMKRSIVLAKRTNMKLTDTDWMRLVREHCGVRSFQDATVAGLEALDRALTARSAPRAPRLG